MGFEEQDAKIVQREEPLHGITPEEVEDMWSEFMDSAKSKCEVCPHAEDPWNPICGVLDQPGVKRPVCPIDAP